MNVGILRPQLARTFGEVGGRADVAGQVAEIARQVHAVGDRQPLGRRLFAGGQIGALRHRQRELAQRAANLGGLAFHLLEAVHGLHRHDHRMLDAPDHLAPLDLLLGQVQDRFIRAGFVQQLDRRTDRGAEFAVAEVALLAQADEQDAVGQRAAHVVQQQRRAQLALHVAAADDFADITVAGAVDQFR